MAAEQARSLDAPTTVVRTPWVGNLAPRPPRPSATLRTLARMDDHDRQSDVSDAHPGLGYGRQEVLLEYESLARLDSSINTLRFTLLGFYITAVGFIVGRSPSTAAALLLMGLTVGVWVLDRRSRLILQSLASRGTYLEREVWGVSGAHAYEGLFSRLYKLDAPGVDPPGPDTATILFGKVTLPLLSHRPNMERLTRISYTNGLGLIFWAVLVYCAYLVVA